MTSDPNRSQPFERALPNSSEAERAILGAILLDNGLFNQATETLEPSDFYIPSHRRVFAAMQTLFARGAEINPILIGEELKKENALESVGGVSFITNLMYGLPHSTNILHYAKVVRGKSTLRNLIKTANKITQEALAEEDEPDAILEEAERLVFGLRDQRSNEGKREFSMKEVASEARTHLLGLNKDDANSAIPTPWQLLNNACRGGFNPTDLWGLIAPQKMGKSAFAKQVAAHAATKGHRVLIFSREMSRLKLFWRFLAPLTDIPVSQIRYGLDENRILRSIGATKDLEDLGIFFNTQTSDIDEARIRVREMIRLQKIGLVIADYTNQFSAKVRKGANRSEEVQALWRGFKNISQEFEVATLALGHPTSDSFESHKTRKGGDERQAPHFHQSAESREAARAVDVGIVLWTELAAGEPGARPATLYIDYQRDEDAGGKIPLIFDGRAMEFRQPGQALDFNS